MNGSSRDPQQQGIALVVTLSLLVILIILVAGLIQIMMTDRTIARNSLDLQGARAMAELGRDHGAALLRQAIESSGPGTFWSSQPGRITVFNADGTPGSATDLYSKANPSDGPSSSVDLNQAPLNGHNPLAHGTPAPEMKVEWVSVRQDPASPASAGNPVVGRYAFWVDDETAKINLNTADGSAKHTTQSFGPGTPTEVDLRALQAGGADLSAAAALSIARQAGVNYAAGANARPFNAASEVLQAPGVPANFARENVFNITSYNRAPEINIFGEPKIPLMTSSIGRNLIIGPSGVNYTAYPNTDPAVAASFAGFGNLTQIYPTSAQLPSTSGLGTGSPALPQTFGYENGSDNGYFDLTKEDYAMGLRIARYLKGYDSRGNAITWPRFEGADPGGFAAKYTDRQIDSIALQILSLMKRGIFADNYLGYSIPSIMPKGFLSGKMVRGLANGPRVNEVTVKFTVTPGSPLKLTMTISVEWHWPEGFQGVPRNSEVTQWIYGANDASGWPNTLQAMVINLADRDTALGTSPFNNLLRNNAGIDFSGAADGYPFSAFNMWPPRPYNGSATWKAGDYTSSSTSAPISLSVNVAPGQTAITFSGGLAIALHTEGGWDRFIDAAPLESLRGPFTGENLADPAVRQAVLDAVIPIGPGGSVTLETLDDWETSVSKTVHMQVADPTTNCFPGDWIVSVSESNITMQSPGGNASETYTHTDGRNTAARPANGGDPEANWVPPQNVAAAKSQRFPSAGYLQYINTGMMPDKNAESLFPIQQHGTPYRRFNLAPSSATSQKTDGGSQYPDWAMLDLFTVPAALQPPGAPHPIQLTLGGATSGRLNPNSPILPFGSLSRTVPLEAMLRGLPVSTSYAGSGTANTTTLDRAQARTIAAAINQYLVDKGRPFILPGEICNVPEVADYLYTGVAAAAQSRNDLVRQIVGNLTTRSNTFSIWAVGQVVKKHPKNTQYGVYEPGDIVQGESKIQAIVERTLDFGQDGVPGNARNAGPDGVVGTPDDPVDPVYHPAMTYPLPYKYRIISVREVGG